MATGPTFRITGHHLAPTLDAMRQGYSHGCSAGSSARAGRLCTSLWLTLTLWWPVKEHKMSGIPQIERSTTTQTHLACIYTAVASKSASSALSSSCCIQILCNSRLAEPERSSSRTAGYRPDRRIDLQSQQFDKQCICTSILNSTRSCHHHIMQQHFHKPIKCAGEGNLTAKAQCLKAASWEE